MHFPSSHFGQPERYGQDQEVVALIKREPLATELLVASESVDRWYTDQGIPYSFETAEAYRAKGSKSSRAPSEATKSANSEHSKPNGSVPHSRHDTMEQKVAVTEVTQRYTHPEKEAADEHSHDDVSPVVEDTSYAVVTEASADDLLDKVFSGLKPPATEDEVHKAPNGGRNDEGNTDADTENRQVVSAYHAPHPTPLSKVVPAQAASQSPESPHVRTPDTRSLASNGSNMRDENGGVLDIFKLSAKDARLALRHRKKDPRLQSNMSLEEKYKLVSNL